MNERERERIDLEIEFSSLPPRRAYKFLHRAHLEPLLSGRVRLGALSYYKRLGLQGAPQGDQYENSVAFRGDITFGPSDERARQWFARRGAITEPGETYDWRNIGFIATGKRDYFAFCMHRSLSAWSSKLRRDAGYDAAVEVVDVLGLAAKLSYLTGNKPLIGRVHYTGGERPLLSDEEEINPFAKPSKYCDEVEYRILLPRVDDDERTHIIVPHSDLPSRMLANHFREIAPPRDVGPPLASLGPVYLRL